MGITISSRNYEIDIGYGGFYQLRMKVAELIGKEVGNHYRELPVRYYHMMSPEERKAFLEKYNQKTEELETKYGEKSEGVFDFLYLPDTGGTLTAGQCVALWEVIRDYDDDIIYGYPGRSNPTTFSVFKRTVKDCVDTNTNLEWF